MGIFIGRRPEAAFTRVPNEWARDPKLSMKAKGLLTYLLSHEDGYRLTIEQVIAETADGKAAIYAAIKELMERSYLRREQERKPGGKVAEVHYYVADCPAQTASWFPASRKSESGDDQGRHDKAAGQTAFRFSASGFSASGESTTKKTRVKKTKVLEDQNTISLSAPSSDAPATAPAELEPERENVDASQQQPEPHNPVRCMLIKDGCPAERVEQVKNRIDIIKNVQGDGFYYTAHGNGSLKVAVVEALQDLNTPQTASDGKPPWCGHCDERTRQRTAEWPENVSVSRCPDCHPLAAVNVQGRSDARRSPSAARAEQALAIADELDRANGHGAYAPGVIRSPADRVVADAQPLYEKYRQRELAGKHVPFRNPPDISAYHGDL